MHHVPSFLLLASILALAAPIAAQSDARPDTVTISGRVTDFEGAPMEGVTVALKNDRFRDVAMDTSDAGGGYSLTAPAGHYMGLIAVKDYQTRFLEFWAWDVPAVQDLEIDPRFHRLELYALNAWRPQGAYPSYQIYFRPMSLTRAHAVIEEVGGMDQLGTLPVLDLAPELTADDLEVTIDGQPVDVLQVSRVREAAGPEQVMFGYVIQVALPVEEGSGDYARIEIVATDPDTGDAGEAWLYVRRQP